MPPCAGGNSREHRACGTDDVATNARARATSRLKTARRPTLAATPQPTLYSPPFVSKQPDPKAAVIGAVGGVASLGSIKLLSATAASNTQPVGRVVCYSDWRSGVVTGVAVNDDPTTCGSGDTETPVLLAAQDYISDVDVALVKGTKLIGRLTFTVKNAAGQPTRYVSCGRVPDSWLGKLMTKTTPAVRGKGANGRLSGIKASCLPTGPLTVPPFYLPPILEETATPGDPRIGVIDSIDEPPLETPLDPGTFIFEFTPRSCKAYVVCVAGSAITTYDAGCDPANPGDNMFFVDAVTGVALPSIACPGPGVDIPEIVIEVPPTQDFSCWAFNNCTVIPPPTLPNDPPPDTIVVPVNTPIPSPVRYRWIVGGRSIHNITKKLTNRPLKPLSRLRRPLRLRLRRSTTKLFPDNASSSRVARALLTMARRAPACRRDRLARPDRWPSPATATENAPTAACAVPRPPVFAVAVTIRTKTKTVAFTALKIKVCPACVCLRRRRPKTTTAARAAWKTGATL